MTGHVHALKFSLKCYEVSIEMLHMFLSPGFQRGHMTTIAKQMFVNAISVFNLSHIHLHSWPDLHGCIYTFLILFL